MLIEDRVRDPDPPNGHPLDRGVRQRDVLSNTPRDKLVLFPRARNNLEGIFSIQDSNFSNAHRAWVRMFPAATEVIDTAEDGTMSTRKVAFVDEAGQEFDTALIKPYAYRHTYCQRHADQEPARTC